MSPSEIAAAALGISEREVASVDLLKDGLTNDSWLVRTSAGAVVVRINNPNAGALSIDRRAEAAVLNVVGKEDIGPEVLLCEPLRHVLVTRYLGPTCSPADMHEPSRIERLAALLRRLHGVQAPRDALPVIWHDLIDDYAATLTTLNRATPLLHEDVRARMKLLALELQSASPPRLCHNDVHHLNLIDDHKLTLLDWEYAGVGEPYFDLASLAFYNDFDMRERALLLRAYEGELHPTSMQRLAKACAVFEYVHDLWHEVRRALSGASSAVHDGSDERDVGSNSETGT